MKLYYKEIYVGNYTIQAIGSTPEKCISAIVKEYKKQFGNFRQNGFESKKEWLEYHDLSAESLWKVEIDKAWTA